jgi:plasmid stability protein
MASRKIDDLPDNTMKALEERARRFHRPVEVEAKEALVNAVDASTRERPSLEDFLKIVKELHDQQQNVWMTEEFVDAAINEGRP